MMQPTKFFIYGFEFRKSIYTIGQNMYEARITITYDLIKKGCNIFKYFRDDNDSAVVYIARSHNVRLNFFDNSGKIVILNKYENSSTNKTDIETALEAVINRLNFDMDYLKRHNKLPKIDSKKRERSPTRNHVISSDTKMNKRPTMTHQEVLPSQVLPTQVPPPQSNVLPSQVISQSTMSAFPGLVIIIEKPTPELVAKLYSMNVNYTLLPEFLIKQMLQIQSSLPPPHMPPPPVPTGAEEGEIVL